MNDNTEMTRLERSIDAPPSRVWELWTTAAGIEQWWAPDGFRTDVQALELRPDGELIYTMTATAPEQVAFMEQHGMPLATTSRKTFTETQQPSLLAYRSLIDFVPDHEPYEHLTVVELTPNGAGTTVTMDVEPLHDEVWTERLLGGRANELDNLTALVSRS